MSNQFEDDYDDEYDEQPQNQRGADGLTPAERRKLQKEAKRAGDLEERLNALEAENVVLRTPGLNVLTDRQRKALLRDHEGERTPEALLESARDLWPERFKVEEEAPAPELQANQRIHEMTAGGVAPSNQALASEAISATSEKDFWAKAAAAGFVSQE